jgi:hypothetical protein
MRGFASDLQRFAQLADELRQPFHQYHAASMRAAHALSSGRFAEAERCRAQPCGSALGCTVWMRPELTACRCLPSHVSVASSRSSRRW